jgi:hypothetical protein
MKIENKRGGQPEFATVEVGEAFMYGDSIYVRPAENSLFNAVRLQDGYVTNFGDGTLIVRVKATVTIE